MAELPDIAQHLDEVSSKTAAKLQIAAKDLEAQLTRARRRLPRHLRPEADLLTEAAQRVDNPKLRPTLGDPKYAEAAKRLCAHLDTIDRADQRKGWWLGMLGGLAFNLLAATLLLLTALVFFDVL